MKKIFSIILTCILLTSCIVSKHVVIDNSLDNLKREDYIIKDEITTVSRANKFWILFIPIGGKSIEKREAQCFDRMVKQNNADGVLSQKYINRKVTVPLIVFTYTFKWTKLTRKPYIIKTDQK